MSVTSRPRLLDLDAAASLSLDVLPPDQARALFVRGAGPERVAGQEAQVDEAVRLCGRLPLAIRIAAARLRHRPSWRVEDLINRGLLAEVATLAHITWRYFLDGGHHRDALLLHSLAVDAAKTLTAAGQDRAVLANALRFYGLTCERLGRFEESMAAYQDTQKACEGRGDPSDLAAVVELQDT